MANAIKKISVQRGYDVTRYALNCFGGAGGQHACLVADALGMTTVLIHPFSSLLSAYGMGLADIRATRQQAIEEAFGAKSLAALNKIGQALCEGRAAAKSPARACRRRRQGARARAHPLCRHRHRAGGRRPASLAADEVAPSRKRTRRSSASSTARRTSSSRRCRSRRSAAARSSRRRRLKTTRAKLPSPARRTQFFSDGEWHNATVYTRDQLAPGHKVKGPAIVIEPHQTVVVEPGWQAAITAKNHLVLTRVVKLRRTHAIGTKADPIMLEVFNNLFMSIAEQMGVALQNTAYSVNIKERLDFSCAVFAA